MAKTVLLVLDIQNGIVDIFNDMDAYLQRFASTIKAAREKGIKAIYVTTCFRKGYPDMHPNNPSASRVVPTGNFIEGSQSVEIHPTVAPNEDDIVITKRRVSSFTGTELEVILRSLGAENLVLAGIATSGAVLSTVRQGADLDFRLTVLKDLCCDRDPEVHDLLMDKVIARQASVVSSEDWVAGLKGFTPNMF